MKSPSKDCKVKIPIKANADLIEENPYGLDNNNLLTNQKKNKIIIPDSD